MPGRDGPPSGAVAAGQHTGSSPQPLDLDGQSLGPEQEVDVVAAAVECTEFGLALGAKARVVQAQARDGFGGDPGRVGELHGVSVLHAGQAVTWRM